MKCERIQIYLIPFTEGTLPEKLSRLVQDHLGVCETCSREVEDLKRTVDVLKHTEYPAMEPAFDLRSRVMSQIAREPVTAAPWWAGFQRYSSLAAVLVILAVAVGTVFPVFFNARDRARQNSVPRSAGFSRKAVERLRSLGYVGEGSPGGPAMKARVSRRPMGPAVPSSAVPARRTDGSHSVAKTRGVAGVPAPVPVRPETMTKRPYAGSSPTGGRGAAGAPGMAGPGGMMAAGNPESPAPADTTDAVAMSKPEGKDYQFENPAPGLAARGASVGVDQRESVSAPAQPAPRAVRDASPRPAKAREASNIYMLEKKLQEFPESRTLLRQLLRAYRDAGRSQDEYAIAQRLTAVDPDNSTYWFDLGQAAEKVGKGGTAVRSYRKAIELGLEGSELELAKGRLQVLGSAEDRQ